MSSFPDLECHLKYLFKTPFKNWVSSFPAMNQSFPGRACQGSCWCSVSFLGVSDRTVQSSRTGVPHLGSGGAWSGAAMSPISGKECHRHGGGLVPAPLLSRGSPLPKWQGSGRRASAWVPGPDGVAEGQYWWGQSDPQDQEGKVLRWRRVHLLLPRSFLSRGGSNGIESGR